jgi:hypothetical protein
MQIQNGMRTQGHAAAANERKRVKKAKEGES